MRIVSEVIVFCRQMTSFPFSFSGRPPQIVLMKQSRALWESKNAGSFNTVPHINAHCHGWLVTANPSQLINS